MFLVLVGNSKHVFPDYFSAIHFFGQQLAEHHQPILLAQICESRGIDTEPPR